MASSLQSKVDELTKELASSTDDEQIQLLFQRAQVYKDMGNYRQCRDDLQQVLKRQPDHLQAKESLADLMQSLPPTIPSDDAKDLQPVDRLREQLAKWSSPEAMTVDTIRQFVTSPDFVYALGLCGQPATPKQDRAVGFLVLTKLLHPPEALEKTFPWTLVIEQCAQCFGQCLATGKNKDKLLAYRTLNALFQINTTIGAALFCQQGILEDMMDVVEFEIQDVQVAMLEVLATASTDASCRKQIMSLCLPWLTKTAKAAPDAMKTLATIALTKLQAQPAKADDIDPQQQDKQPVDALAEALAKARLHEDDMVDQLKRVICDSDLTSQQDSAQATMQHAVEGLAYASMTPAVRDVLVNDPTFLKQLAKLALQPDQAHPLLYGIGTILAYLTMYRPRLSEQQRQMQRLRNLANASKQGAKKADDMDDPRLSDEAVENRIVRVVDQGGALALMALVKSKSRNNCAVASQAYLNLVTPQSIRGKLLQQGVVKWLLPLALSNDHDGQAKATQALAKLAITTDPRLAFQPQQQLDLVRPLLLLCKDDDHALGQFEALMALTNLASQDHDDVRDLIVKQDGLAIFENLQLSNHTMIQRAASEMICNMTMCEQVFHLYTQPTAANQQKIRLWVLLSDHDDPSTRRAASGTLAILCASPDTCQMVDKVDRGYEKISQLLQPDEAADIQHRAVEIVRQMITHLAQPALDGFLKQHVDQALVRLVKTTPSAQNQGARTAALEVLKLLAQNGVTLQV
ncbi:ARM repeat-containing protein [Hesseltinella vesiculosa]|uniref:ARM repeat-containing protein n=1 Tax=Hesseltinella vesiculosa TaxID=101127 RepID=A0A1X2GS47_9FUNG|nr:ARM repeat-containing protein [Hesseltinella vesiculosa]